MTEHRAVGAFIVVALLCGLVACSSDPSPADPEPTSVSEGLLQPDDLPSQPVDVSTEVEPDIDASNSWACAGFEQNVLLDAGWSSDAVRYGDVDGSTVISARFSGGDDASDALEDVRRDVQACRDSLESEGEDSALIDLPLGEGTVAYQSNDPDGQVEGQRAYAVAGSDIVQVTVLVLVLDDSGPISLQALLDRATQK